MKVLIKAPMNVFTGYGNDGIGLTKALVKIGADVYIQPEEVKAPIPAEVAMLLTKEVVAPFDIVIHHLTPANLGAPPALKENAKLVLGWTMWEWTNFDGHENKDKFREQWKHYDALIGYDDVSVEALKEYFDGPVLKLQGGFEPDTWKKVERDWHSEDFYFCQLGVLTPRKDPFLTIQAFTELQHEDEEFKKHAKLMMKTSANSGFSHQIQDVYTNIRVFSDTWPQELIQKFYESAHVLLAPSRGEGKNVPALEFQTTGGAVIATDWAGHREWMHESFAYPLKYTLEPDDIYEPTVLCAKVDIEDYKRQMLHVFKNRSEVRDKAEIASQVIPRLCNWDAVVERLFLRIKDFLPGGTDIYSDYKSLGMEVNRGNGNTMPNWT